jgi:hypothetical protein
MHLRRGGRLLGCPFGLRRPRQARPAKIDTAFNVVVATRGKYRRRDVGGWDTELVDENMSVSRLFCYFPFPAAYLHRLSIEAVE